MTFKEINLNIIYKIDSYYNKYKHNYDKVIKTIKDYFPVYWYTYKNIYYVFLDYFCEKEKYVYFEIDDRKYKYALVNIINANNKIKIKLNNKKKRKINSYYYL
jgi:hypothetical protein